jgi:hypothetical protein
MGHPASEHQHGHDLRIRLLHSREVKNDRLGAKIQLSPHKAIENLNPARLRVIASLAPKNKRLAQQTRLDARWPVA